MGYSRVIHLISVKTDRKLKKYFAHVLVVEFDSILLEPILTSVPSVFSQMDLIKILRKSVYLSETFGLISFKINEVEEGRVFLESKNRSKMVKINFLLVFVLHSFLMIFSTEEIRLAKEDISVKIMRFINLIAFSGGIASMFMAVMRKGKLICDGLNDINALYVWMVSKKPKIKRKESNAPLFLGTVVNYLATVLPVMLTALYVQRNKISKVISYSYYAYSMWLENIFVYQFVIIARFVAEVYGVVTRVPIALDMPKKQLLLQLRRSRKHEEIVKNFIEVLEEVYKYVLFFWICWSFTMILQFVLKVNLRIRVVIWCIFISIRVIVIIYGCNLIKTETEKTAKYLSDALIYSDDEKIKEEIEIYSNQLLHRKPDFNALGFFSLDFPLFHSMVASVATYIVILTQLRGSSKASHHKSEFGFS